jgi:hypothetical protein
MLRRRHSRPAIEAIIYPPTRPSYVFLRWGFALLRFARGQASRTPASVMDRWPSRCCSSVPSRRRAMN